MTVECTFERSKCTGGLSAFASKWRRRTCHALSSLHVSSTTSVKPRGKCSTKPGQRRHNVQTRHGMLRMHSSGKLGMLGALILDALALHTSRESGFRKPWPMIFWPMKTKNIPQMNRSGRVQVLKCLWISSPSSSGPASQMTPTIALAAWAPLSPPLLPGAHTRIQEE